MRSLSLFDLPFLACCAEQIPQDDMESYSGGVLLDSLDGGINWTGPYVSRTNFMGVQAVDDIESYTNGVNLDSLNGGSMDWTGAYVARDNYLGVKSDDDMEAYADLANVDGLNAGNGWTGAYVAR